MCKVIDFLWLKLSALNKDEIVNKICEFALTGKHRMITYFNADCLNSSFKNKVYRDILNQMDMVYAGGMGVVWASRFLGQPLPGRANIMDFYNEFFKEAVKKEISFYFLGAKPGIAQKAAELLSIKFPGLKIKGYSYGYFDELEGKDIIQEINSLKPHILMVGLGVPKQEKWIYQHLQELDINLCWAIGGAFDKLSGYLKAVPSWVSKNGLAWLYRLFQEPKRLCKRYLIGNPVFVYHVLGWKMKKLLHPLRKYEKDI